MSNNQTKYYVHDKAYSIEELERELKRISEIDRDAIIRIQIDQNNRIEYYFEIFSIMKKYGMKNVSILFSKDSGLNGTNELIIKIEDVLVNSCLEQIYWKKINERK
jgi:hypothetical protein